MANPFDDLIPRQTSSDGAFDDLVPPEPKGGALNTARDLTAGVLKIGPTALKAVGDITQLVTAGHAGDWLSDQMESGMHSIDQTVGSDRLRYQKDAFNRIMADPTKGVGDMARAAMDNPRASVDAGISTIGSMFLPAGAAKGAVMLGGKAATATGAAIGTSAAMNAGETYTSIESPDQADKYKGAAISGVASALLGKLFGGGAEGIIARRIAGETGKSGAGNAARAIIGALSKEGAQEAGEEGANYIGEAVGDDKPIDANQLGKRSAYGGALGAVMGGGVGAVNQAGVQPEAAPPVTPGDLAQLTDLIESTAQIDSKLQPQADPFADLIPKVTEAAQNTPAPSTEGEQLSRAEAPTQPENRNEAQPAAAAIDGIQPVSADVGRTAAAVAAGQPAPAVATSDTGIPASITQPAEPVAPPGTVRLYHGGEPGDADGPLWFSRDRRYAQGYADKSNARVWYVDVPADHPSVKADDEFGVLPATNVEMPAEIARQRKPIDQPAAPAFAAPLQIDGTRAMQIEQPTEGLRPGDIVAATGKPFKTEAAARKEAKIAGKEWKVRKGGGGFVVRHQPATDKQIANGRRQARERGQIDTDRDSLFAAIAKLGGINIDQLTKQWGFDPAEFKNLRSGIKPVARKTGGMNLDAMGERLAELGYLSRDENGKHDLSELFDLFDGELRGNKHFTPQGYNNQAQALMEAEWASQQAIDALNALPEEAQQVVEDTLDEDIDQLTEAELEARLEQEGRDLDAAGFDGDAATDGADDAGGPDPFRAEGNDQGLADADSRQARERSGEKSPGRAGESTELEQAEARAKERRIAAQRRYEADADVDARDVELAQIRRELDAVKAKQAGQDDKFDDVPFSRSDVMERPAQRPGIDSSTVNVDGVERSTFNSAGQQIAYTKPVLDAFWRWYKDGETDSRGRPVIKDGNYTNAAGQTKSHQNQGTFDAASNDAIMSRGKPSRGLSVDAVKKAIAADTFNHDVDVYATMADAPDYIRRQAGEEGGGEVEGFWNTVTNRVALIAENLDSPAHARRIARHELIGHYGLENMLQDSADPDAMARLVRRVIAAERDGNKVIRDLAAQVDRSQPDLDDARRAKEIIAIMAERNIHNSITKRVYDAIRKFLKKIGFIKSDMTDASIAALLRDAQNYLRAAGRPMIAGQPAAAFGRASPVLDLDAPLSQQSEPVRRSLAKEVKRLRAEASQRNEPGAESVDDRITGRELMDKIADRLGSESEARAYLEAIGVEFEGEAAFSTAEPIDIKITEKRDGKYLEATSDAGQVGGNVRDGALHINFAKVEDDYRGKGYGKNLYRTLIDNAHGKGLRVFSDGTVEGAAVKVYEALEREGYGLIKTDGVIDLGPDAESPLGALAGPTPKGSDDHWKSLPVFEVTPKSAATSPTALESGTPLTRAEVLAKQEADAKAAKEAARQDKPRDKNVTADQVDMFNEQGSLFSKTAEAQEELDTAPRDPITAKDVFGTVRDVSGRRKWAAGTKAYRKLTDAIDPMLGKVKLSNTAPDAFKAMLRDYQVDQQKAQANARKIAEVGVETLTPEERVMISDIIEKNLIGDIPPEGVVKIAADISAALKQQAQDLVDLGMASDERLIANYLPRAYRNPLLARMTNKDMFASWYQKARLRINGNRLKSRGLVKTVPVAEIAKYQKLKWKISGLADGDTMPADLLDALESGKQPPPQYATKELEVLMWRDFTADERAKMGEIRDGILRYAMGYTDTQRDIAIGRLFKAIADNDELSSKINPGGWAKVPDQVIPGTEIKRYGALSGLYVPTYIRDAIERNTQPKGPLMQVYDRALSFWKEGKTIWNPVAHGNNMISNVFTMHFAGLNPADPRHWRGTVREYRTKGQYYQEAIDHGLFGTEWAAVEIQELFMPDLAGEVDLETVAASRFNKTVDALKKIGKPVTWYREQMQKAYEFEDQFFKLMLFIDRRKNGASIDDAIADTERYIFNYSDVPEGVQVIKRVYSPFFSYTYKALPMLLHTAMTAPHRLVAPIALLGGMNWLSYAIMGGDEEEERKGMPEYLQGKTLIGTDKALRMPFNVGDRPAFMDMSRRVPLGDLFDMHNQTGGLAVPAPFMPSHPLFTTTIAMVFNMDTFTGKDLVKKSDTDWEAAATRGEWLYKQFTPNAPFVPGSWNFDKLMNGAANAFDTEMAGYTGFTKAGDATPLAIALLDVAGGTKIRSFDPQRGKDFKQYDLNKERQEIQGNIRSAMRNQSMTEDKRREYVEGQCAKLKRLQEKREDLR